MQVFEYHLKLFRKIALFFKLEYLNLHKQQQIALSSHA